VKYTIDNTSFSSWFERDRAYVYLSFSDGCEDIIFELWDEAVTEFIDDGFKSDRETWHQAMVNYANQHGLGQEPRHPITKPDKQGAP
jgi:hypothetical protein